MARIAVVGAANVDIGGFSDRKIVKEDSNPGRVCMTMGGVGRNIACNLARLGVETQLVTALGDDSFAARVREDCAENGIGLDHAQVIRGARTSVYLFVADDDGDMNVAVNDMSLHDSMTPERLKELPAVLNTMDAVVLDANLPEETLTFLSANLTVPVFADAVSAAKVDRLRGTLKHLCAFKPNRIEAERLTGISIDGEETAKRAAQAIVEMGVQYVYLSMGTKGICCASREECFFLPCRVLPMVSATGAGDSFTAALVWAYVNGLDMKHAALAGMAASSITVESEETVHKDINEARLRQRIALMEEVL